jgi:hypothetical protein
MEVLSTMRRFLSLFTVAWIVVLPGPASALEWFVRRTGLTNANFNYVTVAYGDGRWLLANAGSASFAEPGSFTPGSIFLADGTGWPDASTQPDFQLSSFWGVTIRSSAFGNGRFVVFGTVQGGVRGQFRDATAWLISGTNVFATSVIEAIYSGYPVLKGAFVNDSFLAIPQVGGIGLPIAAPDDIRISKDATNWTKANVPVLQDPSGPRSSSLSGFAYGNGRYVAVGYFVMSSTDVQNWTEPPILTFPPLNSVAFGAGNFVAVGNGGVLVASPDGTNWTSRVLETKLPLNSIAFGAGVFAAVGGSNNSAVIVSSSDGVTWAEQSLPGIPALAAVTFGEESFLAVGPSGTIIESANSIRPAFRADGIVRRRDGSLRALLNVPQPTSFTLERSSNFSDWTVLETFPKTNGLVEVIAESPADSRASYLRARILP